MSPWFGDACGPDFIKKENVLMIKEIIEVIKEILNEELEPEWKGRLEKRWRWSTFSFEWGRLCYIVHPVEGGRDTVWWEWEDVELN